ncbi:MAG TPA: PVC-type heme-binding CxxCH protein [Pirellulaceae bacterium]|nr:PVC-type heme-binding CxxCH protein [Pirellulaceae bacterium]
MRAGLRLLVVVGCLLGGPGSLHAQQPPAPYNSGAGADELPLDATRAAAGFRLPEGFRAQVFAAEPDVQNPVAMTWDTRGRLWVAECYTYADRSKKYDLTLRDRVLILADKDGDGRADERKVFCDNVQQLMSVEVGLGGVWLIALPRLLFIPDRDGNDIPDGPPEVVLDGFETSPENYHNCANGLRWGPDGWLYGRCGASSPGRIGPPGATDAERVPIYGGLWRYHPTRHIFETLCHGTTNPWGHDWDAHGELFFVNTVTGHLFHMIPGAHYTRSATVTVNPWVYAPIDTHADHLHWDTGRGLADSENVGTHDGYGGGHAHCGAMIYLADQWPEEYRGRLMTLNLHGRRINVDRLEREGCGYAARHEPDIAHAADTWFRGIDLSYGPDGSVYMLDWSDTGECHEHDGIHRLSGRVFRISYGDAAAGQVCDLTSRSTAELAALHSHVNEWFVRQARRELANRAALGVELTSAKTELVQLMTKPDADPVLKLRALWTLYTLGATSRRDLEKLLADPDEHLRVCGLRLLVDFWPLDTVHGQVRSSPAAIDKALAARLPAMAREDSSGLMRLVLASTLQRLPPAHRSELAAALASHEENADDHDLPKLLWYGLAPLVKEDAAALVRIAAEGKFPLTRQWIAAALGQDPDRNRAALDQLLQKAMPQIETARADVVRGLVAGLAGHRRADPPPSWDAFAASLKEADPAIRDLVRRVSVVFGDGLALDEVRQVALDGKARIPERQAALKTLIDARPDDLREICQKLLRVRFLNTTALAGLTLFDDPAIGEQLAKNYSSFHPTERPAVIETLVSRATFAGPLLEQIEAGKIPRSDLSALHARQIRSLGDETLTARLSEVWGELRDSPRERHEAIERLKEQLTPKRLATADLRRGRGVFQTNCANCHRLYGAGADVGPDLTGSGRHNLAYLLENIVDPSAVVNKDYRMSIVRVDDGRVLNGLILSQDDRRVVLQTAKEKFTILREEIEQIAPTTLSPMPDGILQPLTGEQVRDLVAYLMGAGQVELPASFETNPAAGGGNGRQP